MGHVNCPLGVWHKLCLTDGWLGGQVIRLREIRLDHFARGASILAEARYDLTVNRLHRPRYPHEIGRELRDEVAQVEVVRQHPVVGRGIDLSAGLLAAGIRLGWR